MIRLRHLLLVGALLGLTTATAQAGVIGSLALGGQNINPLHGDPITTTSYTNSDTVTNAPGSGIFGPSGMNVLSGVSFGSLTVNKLNSNGYAFSLTSPGVGTFTGVTNGAWSPFTAPGTTSRFLNVSVTGTYKDLLSVSRKFVASITFTQSTPGGQVSQAVSIDVFAIPEPSSVALGAIGLVSVGLVALRKRRSSK